MRSFVHLDVYKFPELERVEDPERRRYKVPQSDGAADILLPSVTTVLASTKHLPKELIAWKKRLGEAEAEAVKEDAARRGSHMHNYLEADLMGTSYTSMSPAASQGRKMATQIRTKVLDRKIDIVYAAEARVWYHDPAENIGYAGTCDLFVQYGGTDSIYDFKQANREKTEEMIHDYYLQVAAYAHAINFMHGTHIRNGLIIVCGTDLNIQEFPVTPEKIEEAWKEFETRLKQYHKLFA